MGAEEREALVMSRNVKILCSDLSEALIGSGIEASVFDKDPPMVSFSIFISRWYAGQTVWRRWWIRLQILWFLIRGKEYTLEEVIIQESAPLREMETFCREWAEKLEAWEARQKER